MENLFSRLCFQHINNDSIMVKQKQIFVPHESSRQRESILENWYIDRKIFIDKCYGEK